MAEQQRRVLVVDDEPTLRVVLCRFLKAWGYRAAEAGDGVAALQMARELQQELRLIVTDIDMPGSTDGLKLAETVRDHWPSVKSSSSRAIEWLRKPTCLTAACSSQSRTRRSTLFLPRENY